MVTITLTTSTMSIETVWAFYSCTIIVMFSLSQERKALNSILRKTHQKIYPIKGDGNCLFRAVAQALFDDDSKHQEVRIAVCTELEANKQFFQNYIDIDEEWDLFLANTKIDGSFGGEPCLLAITRVYHCTVFVHSLNTPTFKYEGTNDTVIELAYLANVHYDLIVSSRRRDARSLTEKKDEIFEKNKDALVPKGRSEIVAMITAYMEQAQPSQTRDQFDYAALKQNELTNEISCTKWLYSVGLLPTTKSCPKCGQDMVLQTPYRDHPNGTFFCRACQTSISPRNGTFFEGTKLPLSIFLRAMIAWLQHSTYSGTLQDLKISSKTFSNIALLMNHFANYVIQKNSQKIGGFLRIVEIDEALLHRRKYDRGREKDTGWVIGGIERPITPKDPPKLFLKMCDNREAKTLESIILDNVEKGSIIMTDSFKSYSNLTRLGFYHFTVNHSKNFVNPATEAHTQRIEGQWHQIRQKAFPKTGCRHPDVELYLAAYLYRRRVNGSISSFLDDIKKLTVDDVKKIFQSRKDHASDKKQELAERKVQLPTIKQDSNKQQTNYQATSRAEDRMDKHHACNEETLVEQLVHKTRRNRKVQHQQLLNQLRQDTDPDKEWPRYNLRRSQKK